MFFRPDPAMDPKPISHPWLPRGTGACLAFVSPSMQFPCSISDGVHAPWSNLRKTPAIDTDISVVDVLADALRRWRRESGLSDFFLVTELLIDDCPFCYHEFKPDDWTAYFPPLVYQNICVCGLYIYSVMWLIYPWKASDELVNFLKWLNVSPYIFFGLHDFSDSISNYSMLYTGASIPNEINGISTRIICKSKNYLDDLPTYCGNYTDKTITTTLQPNQELVTGNSIAVIQEQSNSHRHYTQRKQLKRLSHHRGNNTKKSPIPIARSTGLFLLYKKAFNQMGTSGIKGILDTVDIDACMK